MAHASLEELYLAASEHGSFTYTQVYAHVAQLILRSMSKGIQQISTLPRLDFRILKTCVQLRNLLGRLQDMPDSVEFLSDIGYINHSIDDVLHMYGQQDVLCIASSIQQLKQEVENLCMKFHCKYWTATCWGK